MEIRKSQIGCEEKKKEGDLFVWMEGMDGFLF
jgi:hypothetical protein